MLTTVLLAFAGWWMGYWTSLRRDRAAKKRDLRIQYLIEAYRRLEDASNRIHPSRENEKALESAIADIQLFGSEEQVELAIAFALDLAGHRGASVDALLESLRSDLRKQLDLGVIPGKKHIYESTLTNQNFRNSVWCG